MKAKQKLIEQQRKLKEKEAVLKARLAKIEAKERTQDRKKDTRRKILLGALAFKKMQELPAFKEQITKDLDGFLTNPRDRELFELDTVSETYD
jgi:hypothetical protein